MNIITKRITRRLANICNGHKVPDPIVKVMDKAVTDYLARGFDPKQVERVIEKRTRRRLIGIFGIHHHIGKNARTGTETIVMDKHSVDFDHGSGEPWGAECVTHGTTIFVETKGDAMNCARDPTIFCDDCRSLWHSWGNEVD